MGLLITGHPGMRPRCWVPSWFIFYIGSTPGAKALEVILGGPSSESLPVVVVHDVCNRHSVPLASRY